METSNYLTHPAISYVQLHQLRKYLKGINGFIAGGCFKNIFQGEKARDIDIFFENVENYELALKVYQKKKNLKEVYSNDNCTGFYDTKNKISVELIKSIFGSCRETLDRFDFTIVKVAFHSPINDEEPKLIYHPKFFEHLLLRRLVIDGDVPKPVATFNRALKYAKYGYGLCRESKQNLTKMIIERGDVTQLTNDLYFGFD
jgi:hypothetical protein